MSLKKGFTLIELLVVVAIIGLLASIVMTSLNSARAKAKDTRRITNVREIEKALELYYDINNTYPYIQAYITNTYESQWTTTFATALQPYLPAVPNMTEAPPNGYLYLALNGGQKYGLAVGLETSGFNSLMTGDGGYFPGYYEVGSGARECGGVAKDWWNGLGTNCP